MTHFNSYLHEQYPRYMMQITPSTESIHQHCDSVPLATYEPVIHPHLLTRTRSLQRKIYRLRFCFIQSRHWQTEPTPSPPRYPAKDEMKHVHWQSHQPKRNQQNTRHPCYDILHSYTNYKSIDQEYINARYANLALQCSVECRPL